jgi:hypothetical protein
MPQHCGESIPAREDPRLENLALLCAQTDLAFVLVHVDATMLHG